MHGKPQISPQEMELVSASPIADKIQRSSTAPFISIELADIQLCGSAERAIRFFLSGDLFTLTSATMDTLRRLLFTDESISTFVLRLTLGIVFFPHGAQMTVGWFGGLGFQMSLAGLNSELPQAISLLVILAESLGSICLIFGFLTRLASLGIFCVMIGAIALVHARAGFFMNWMDVAGKHEGFEYHLLALGIAFSLIVRGGGTLSIDRWLSRQISSNRFERINITQPF
jgi:putative oxidoreductase